VYGHGKERFEVVVRKNGINMTCLSLSLPLFFGFGNLLLPSKEGVHDP